LSNLTGERRAKAIALLKIMEPLPVDHSRLSTEMKEAIARTKLSGQIESFIAITYSPKPITQILAKKISLLTPL
jgi:hypothetical protein